MNANFVSSYLPLGKQTAWLRGNHHGHTTRSDGEDDPFETLTAYEAAGYDYIALSEHDLFVDPRTYQDRTTMTVLPAVEITSAAGQTLMHLGAGPDIPTAKSLTMPEIAAFVAARGGLFVADHPNWIYAPPRRHATLDALLTLPSLGAIEIYTGVIERLAGSPYALEVWDGLLTAGGRVFGHAVDDQHSVMDRFLGWNSVQWPAGEPLSAEGVIGALSDGRFYASTGVTITKLGLTEDRQTIVVESDAEQILWRVRDGMLAEITDGGNGRLSLDALPRLPRLSSFWQHIDRPADAIYVRAELVGRKGSYAWTQPFFLEQG